MFRILLLLAIAASLASAQTLTEAAIAAAGGSAAGVAGKPVSDTLDRLSGLLKGAAATGEVRPAPAKAAIIGPVQPAPPPLVRIAAVVKQAVAGVAEGTSRQELIAAAGSPSARIVMGEGAHVMEVYTYRSNGEWVASVNLTDGTVTRIRTSVK